MQLTPISRGNGLIAKKPVSIWRRVFPQNLSIMAMTMAAVGLVYGLFGVARITWIQPDDLILAYSGFAGSLLVTLFFMWVLYRFLTIIGEAEASRAIVILTLPALMLAIGASYFNGLIMDSAGLLSGRMNTFDLLFIHYLILAGWGGLYLALVQGENTRIAVEKSEQLERLTRESESRALRFQLNPHFVFNALNSVSSLVMDQQNKKAETLVDGLADYMRVVLQDDGQNILTVREEIEQQIRYLEIEQVRFPERLKYETHIDVEVAEWKIPALIVQPLIENAIKFGVARATVPVRIIITAIANNGRLKLSVANDGKIAGDERVSEIEGKSTGTGLTNVKDRLAAIYGPSAALITANSKDGMAVATIIIPDETFIFPDM